MATAVAGTQLPPNSTGNVTGDFTFSSAPTIHLPASVPVGVDGVSLVDPKFDSLRNSPRPIEALGFYSVEGSVSYTTTTANNPLWSFRWGDATRLCIVLLFEVFVIATAFTTAGTVERQLMVARSFTASDSAGTALTPTGNNAKARTSYGTSLVTDIRIGSPLTAGTRTLDANPYASVANWMSAVGTVISRRDGILVDAIGGQTPPIVLAQNEGLISRFGAAETASTRVSYYRMLWAEVNSADWPG